MIQPVHISIGISSIKNGKLSIVVYEVESLWKRQSQNQLTKQCVTKS